MFAPTECSVIHLFVQFCPSAYCTVYRWMTIKSHFDCTSCHVKEKATGKFSARGFNLFTLAIDPTCLFGRHASLKHTGAISQLARSRKGAVRPDAHIGSRPLIGSEGERTLRFLLACRNQTVDKRQDGSSQNNRLPVCQSAFVQSLRPHQTGTHSTV